MAESRARGWGPKVCRKRRVCLWDVDLRGIDCANLCLTPGTELLERCSVEMCRSSITRLTPRYTGPSSGKNDPHCTQDLAQMALRTNICGTLPNKLGPKIRRADHAWQISFPCLIQPVSDLPEGRLESFHNTLDKPRNLAPAYRYHPQSRDVKPLVDPAALVRFALSVTRSL